MGVLKLNLGSGTLKIEGFQNVDRKSGQEVFPLDFQTGSADEIRASHILEHFPEGQIKAVLTEWRRVLKPLGIVRIAVPNLKEAYARQSQDPLWPHYIMGGHVDGNDIHHSVWTKSKLVHAMLEAGFIVPEGISQKEWVSEIQDCASLPVSLNLMGIKPPDGEDPAKAEPIQANEKKEVSVQLKMIALASLPRLGFNDFWGCVMDALAPWRIPVVRFMGAWWHRGIAEGFQKAIDTGVDVVIVLDYDSFFTHRHLNALLRHLVTHPEADAVFPVQVRRNHGTPLCSAQGADEKGEISIQTDTPLECTTGHFGLTLIKVDAIKKIPKPWFMDSANEEGKYSCDPDIFFWRKFKQAGNRLFMLPWVHIGHGEYVVSEADPLTFRHRFTRVGEWFKRENPSCGHQLENQSTTASQDGNAENKKGEENGTP